MEEEKGEEREGKGGAGRGVRKGPGGEAPLDWQTTFQSSWGHGQRCQGRPASPPARTSKLVPSQPQGSVL